MGQNLRALLREDVCYTAEQLVQILTDVIPGRSVGDRFVLSTEVVPPRSLIMEMDDGCKFMMTCKKLN